jgi:UV DNA damage endonuclease
VPYTAHRLGFAVKVLGKDGLRSHDTRRWQSGPHLAQSLRYLEAILEYLDAVDIRMYRFSSSLAPYASHPGLPGFRGQVRECRAELSRLGELARRRGIRLSSHPGQYTVLNSERPEVAGIARTEIEVQAELLDALGCGPEAVVVVHVGGTAGGRDAALSRFLRGHERLSEVARRRLVVENDDRSFGLGDVLQLHAACGVPVVWDALHHRCHDPEGIDDPEALALALDTWAPDVVPKIHFSSPRLDVDVKRTRSGRRIAEQIVVPPLRAHADLIDSVAFDAFVRETAGARDFDVMLEAKAKDLALVALREQLTRRGFAYEQGRLHVPAIARLSRGNASRTVAR